MVKKKSKPVKRRGETRDKILAACFACVAKYGIPETTVSRIASIVGIPHTLVLYHFPTMEGLYFEATLVALEGLKKKSMECIEAGGSNPMKALEGYIEAPFHWADENPREFMLWLYFYTLASAPGRFRNLNDSIRIGGRERIQALLQACITAKMLPARITSHADEIAFFIQATITGAVIQTATETGGDFSTNAVEVRKRIVKMLME